MASTDIVIACCRDEEDLIAPFIDFYLDAGFDKICLVDNGSTDRTIEIVRAHPARRNVVLKEDRRLGFDVRLKEYYDLFRDLADRWVFFIDVDEFIYFEEGAKEFFGSLDDHVNCLQFLIKDMFHDVDQQRPFPHPLLSHCQEVEFHDTVKEVCKARPVRRIYAGKHHIDLPNRCAYRPDNVFIRHFYFRSPDQVRKKLINRWQTEKSFTEDDRNLYSVFDREVQRQWLAETRRMIEDAYWKRFFEETPPYEFDATIKRWYVEKHKRLNRNYRVSQELFSAGR